MSTEQILEERGNNYGDFTTVANLTQHLEYVCMKHYHDTHPNSDPLPPFMRESLHMIFQKVARAVNGNPYYDDSWRDIAGYAQLVVNVLERNQAPPQLVDTEEVVND